MSKELVAVEAKESIVASPKAEETAPKETYSRKLKVTFETGLAQWIDGISQSKRLAHALACMALQHFVEHGNTAKLQTLLEAFQKHGKNYIRIAAYKRWMQVHSPITMEDGKLVKDKTREFDDALIEKAMETPFWDFAPDREDVVFSDTDVVVSLKRALSPFARQSYVAKDEAATAKVVEATKLVASL